MARKLDSHFKCPRSLKTMFALTPVSPDIKQKMMEAEKNAQSTEYVVEPRSAKSIPTEEKRGRR